MRARSFIERGKIELLELIPLSLKEANEFVALHHRHHGAVVGHKFSIGCALNGNLVGCAIVGRPVSRHLDDGFTLEVTRLCSLGDKNVCSFLYSACARASKAMGYRRIVTYILESEMGTSLKASGWENEGRAGKPHWTGERNINNRYLLFPELERSLAPPEEFKIRYVKILRKEKIER